MSTGYACEFFEARPGQWYYALQRGNCPVGAPDWTDYADVFGPFPTEGYAIAHLSRNHANPGGWSTSTYSDLKSFNQLEKYQLLASMAGR